MSSTDNRTYSTGKRKTAVARVWIMPGTGVMTINGHPADQYFERETSRMIARQSLELLEITDKYDVLATVAGGSHSAQAEAMRHGIAPALCLIAADNHPSLNRSGFLTRDPRSEGLTR